jgi:peptidoglycan/xylan/chitin deacetylase (PgdA/CDA1 family)
MKTIQKTGKIQVPEGKKAALAICFEFNAQSIWWNDAGPVSQFAVSRGELDAEVCVPRILGILGQYRIKATFFIPGHTADTFPDACGAIIDQGHEVAHHGYNHRSLSSMTYEEEDMAMQMGFSALAKLGVKPLGYRAPGGEFSDNTLPLLEKYEFLYDNSLMGNDIYPYYPRPVTVYADRGCILGDPSQVLELPTSLHMDDFPFMDTAGRDPLLPAFDCMPPEELHDRCVDIYEYACRFEGTMLTLTLHTQATGNRSRIAAFERLLEHYLSHDAWIVTCEQLANAAIPSSFQI